MSIAVIGKNGQLATELSRLAGAEVVLLEREEIDITSLDSVRTVLTELAPTSIINAAAYTAVDKAESDEDNARLINATAVEHLATVAKELAIPLVHVSTDYVFNGDKGSPYLPHDEYEPLGVYGQTKAEGEQAITRIYPEGSCVLRTSWVYSSYGNNFVKTMLRLMNEKPQLGVIDDQIGTPTWAKGLAQACLFAAKQPVTGMHHWTDLGVCSWYDFAVAIQQIGLQLGLVEKAIPINPIPTSAYPTPAKRPSYSVLDKASLNSDFKDVPKAHWQAQLQQMMEELVKA
ncbi:MAG TPA: dTDP-4-dehydrorhamnose reductase [Alteromonas australica]|uniref:dTDP-4-dehydrorhamnose reductase n=1 Tax=Alteromonas australica TaxID=589873 RepID=A0A358E352_9ALTE|nr:dTDP-4-dehydrorhamnose reductase [Alteromonas australica]|tara:strand:+ start:979 stop:1842 length:864 start_codon:yes stop_codon:yes gene_type:complete